MNLLFDQNISFKVPKKLQDVFPAAKYLSDLRLENYTDIEIWNYAKINNFCIVTFDSDFIDISTLKGFPPKIIWLRVGNTSTDNIVICLQSNHSLIKEFLNNPDIGFLEIK
jgi:predicted nuclease of predicted toxin-antitoxin system